MKTLLSVLAGMLLGLFFMLLPYLNARIDDTDPSEVIKAENAILRQDNRRKLEQNKILSLQIDEMKQQLAACRGNRPASPRYVQQSSAAPAAQGGTAFRPVLDTELPGNAQPARQETTAAVTPNSLKHARQANQALALASNSTCRQRQMAMRPDAVYQPGTVQPAARYRSTNWAVQVGSFTDLCMAEETAQRTQRDLSTQDVYVYCKRVKGTLYYAVVTGQLSSRQEAYTYRDNIKVRRLDFIKGDPFPVVVP